MVTDRMQPELQKFSYISMRVTTQKTQIMKAASTKLNAKLFLDQLMTLRTGENNSRFFRDEDTKNKIMGVRMLNIFNLTKQFIQMDLGEIEKLLESHYYEARLGAVSIMDFQAREKKSPLKKERSYLTFILKGMTE